MRRGLRIIAGDARSRWVKSPYRDRRIRPILARFRKSLFDILSWRIQGVKFLDLFAGTGIVGLEALSRGAGLVIFVEQDKRCCRFINESIKRFAYGERARVFARDITRGLVWLKPEQFGLIFLGPPYRDKDGVPQVLTTPTLNEVVRAELVTPGGWIIAQHHRKEKIIAPQGWEIFRKESYGDTNLSFIHKNEDFRKIV